MVEPHCGSQNRVNRRFREILLIGEKGPITLIILAISFTLDAVRSRAISNFSSLSARSEVNRGLGTNLASYEALRQAHATSNGRGAAFYTMAEYGTD
jgi:hypothetical protein